MHPKQQAIWSAMNRAAIFCTVDWYGREGAQVTVYRTADVRQAMALASELEATVGCEVTIKR